MNKHTDYRLGSIIVRYLEDHEHRAGMMLLPAACKAELLPDKNVEMDPLVQIKLVGDMYQGAYAQGHTLRNSESTMRMKMAGQKAFTETDMAGQKRTIIETVLEDERGYRALHTVCWEEGAPYIRCTTCFENNSPAPVKLELLSSFSLTGISPYAEGDCAGAVAVHRIQSRWSQEGRLLTQTLEDLQLEKSWGGGAVRCERFGQAGSMPVNHYFPFAAVEDTKANVIWGAQLAVPASWQMEIYRMDENIALSGGLADREFGHWMKKVGPGERFTGPEAILSVSAGMCLDEFCQRLTKAGEAAVNAGPDCEQDLPVVFNEYCTTWGCPSNEKIRQIVETIRGRGFAYFVIDAGWYKKEGVSWDSSMGDYVPSRELFPEGLEKTTAMIREAGMIPGLWFEMENVGRDADAYSCTDHMLRRDGFTLTTTRRRFWDMRDPWVTDYLRERVIGTLKRFGFGYIKIDYNDTIGIGCDGAESPGEGLRCNMAATMDFIGQIRESIPDIVVENCASGGHRLEPGFMGATAMASFSDAHECPEIPIIAACLHRVILPRQSQIWAVIRQQDSLRRIAYSVAATFLGRMCLSGDVTNLSGEQWDLIDRGIAFYREAAPIIRSGVTRIVSKMPAMIRHPQGWQGVVRLGENGEALVVIHTFADELPEKIEISLPSKACWRICSVYTDTDERPELDGSVLTYHPSENWKAIAVRLSQRDVAF